MQNKLKAHTMENKKPSSEILIYEGNDGESLFGHNQNHSKKVEKKVLKENW